MIRIEQTTELEQLTLSQVFVMQLIDSLFLLSNERYRDQKYPEMKTEQNNLLKDLEIEVYSDTHLALWFSHKIEKKSLN